MLRVRAVDGLPPLRSAAGTRTSRHRQRLLVLAAAAAPLPALAVEKDWNPAVASGNWTTPGNWVQGSIPAGFDTVFIVNSDATNRIVTFDYTGGANFLAFR